MENLQADKESQKYCKYGPHLVSEFNQSNQSINFI